MPKGSKALSRARETEIIDACAELYETMGFRDITIRDIGEHLRAHRSTIISARKRRSFWHCLRASMRRGVRSWKPR